MLQTILNQLILRRLPIISLTSVTNTDEVSDFITYHTWTEGIVKAVWSEPPQILFLSELQYLLNQPLAEDSTVQYIYNLAPSARERVLTESVVNFLKFNPTISLRVGVPVGLTGFQGFPNYGPAPEDVSIGLTGSSIFSISGSPVINSGDFDISLAIQPSGNKFLGTSTGASGVPSFRNILIDDLPVAVGTVQSVDISAPTIFSVAGNPITSSGTITIGLNNQNPIKFFAGPTGGSDNSPTFRTIGYYDLPPVVTSVGFTAPAIFSVAGSPVTGASTIAMSLANQSANLFWAGPTGGSATAPTFRSIGINDIPSGIVKYVGLTGSSIFSINSSPITTSGTIGINFAAQSSNMFFAGPFGVGPSVPTFRILDYTDFPSQVAWQNQTNWFTYKQIISTEDVGLPTLTIYGVSGQTGHQTNWTDQGAVLSYIDAAGSLFFDVGTGKICSNNGTLLLTTAGTNSISVTSTGGGNVGINATGATGSKITINATDSINLTANHIKLNSTDISGVVTYVGVTGSSILSIVNSPIISSGTVGINLASQSANKFLSGPTGGSAVPTFRSIDYLDLPQVLSYVGMTVPAIFSIAGSPITNSGTLAVSLANQSPNTFWAGATGGSTTPNFRAIDISDIPSGIVKYVGLTGSSIFNINSSPITTSGTFGLGLSTQSPNMFFAGPTGGSNAIPTLRAIGRYDLPATIAYTDTVQIFTVSQTFKPGTSEDVGLTIQGLSGQTGHLTNWKNNAGTVLTYIDETGGFNFQTGTGYINSNNGNLVLGTASPYSVYLGGNGGGNVSINATGDPASLIDLTTVDSITLTAGTLKVNCPIINGLVSFVDLTGSPIFSIIGNPVASSGTINIDFQDQSEKTFLAGPISGGEDGPTFRTIEITDLPSVLSYVDATVPSIFNIAGNPVINSGTLAISLANQAINKFWAGPTGGSSAVPTFRSIDINDIPSGIVKYVGLTGASIFNINSSPITTSGTFGLGLSTQSINTFLAGPTGGSVATPTMRTIGYYDLPQVVSYIGLNVPSIFGLAGSPVISSGTPTISLNTQAANKFFVGPTGGSDAVPTFRIIDLLDIPSGVVKYVGLTGSSIFSINSSPVTTSGTIGLALTSQTQNKVLASPTGSTGVPSFRSIDYLDLPPVVTNVGFAAPAIFSVAGSPVTSASTITMSLATQSANLIWAGPTGGSAAAPTFRTIDVSDIPAGIVKYVGVTGSSIFSINSSPVITSGTIGISLAAQSANKFLSGPTGGGTAVPTMRSIGLYDLPATVVNYTDGQANNTFLSGPIAFGPLSPTFRVLDYSDFPSQVAWQNQTNFFTYHQIFSTDNTGLNTLSVLGIAGQTAKLINFISELGDVANIDINGSFNFVYGTGKVRSTGGNLLLSTSSLYDISVVPDGGNIGISAVGNTGSKVTINGRNSVNMSGGTLNLTFGTINGLPAGGTVNYVGVTGNSIFNINSSPVTVSGTIGIDLATQAANKVLAGPTGGSATIPNFRSLGSYDLPTDTAYLDIAQTFTASQVFKPTTSGGVPITAQGLSGQTGHLTDWKNVGGTVLTYIDAAGGIYFNSGAGKITSNNADLILSAAGVYSASLGVNGGGILTLNATGDPASRIDINTTDSITLNAGFLKFGIGQVDTGNPEVTGGFTTTKKFTILAPGSSTTITLNTTDGGVIFGHAIGANYAIKLPANNALPDGFIYEITNDPSAGGDIAFLDSDNNPILEEITANSYIRFLNDGTNYRQMLYGTVAI